MRRVPTVVVQELSHNLILGYDFWKISGLRITREVDPVEMVQAARLRQVPTELALTSSQQERFVEALGNFLVTTESFLGRTHVLEHDIELIDGAKPFYARPHLFSPEMEVKISLELDRMLAQGIVVPSKSPVASPVVPVEKPDGSVRLCLDSRLLNDITVKDKFPVPNIGHILARIQHTKYLCSVDLSKAFWQVPLNGNKRQGQMASAQELTAFIVSGRGLFHFKVMPFGLCNSPATQCRLMTTVLGHDLEPHVFCYMDDIILLGKDVDHMMELIRKVAHRLREANLSINFEKCKFFAKQLKFLGYVLSEAGLQADPGKLSTMKEFSTPKNLKGVRRFLGMTGYYRRLIRDYSGIAAPLTNLLKQASGRLIWSEEAEKSFQALKTAMMSAPVVANPDFSKEFHLQCDASDVSAAAALGQYQGETEVIIAYYSHKWTGTEATWGATEREGACVLYAIKHFRGYLWGRSFKVITDAQALTHLRTVKTDGSSRLARWALELNQYSMTVKHRSGRLSVVPDALSRALETLFVTAIDGVGDDWYDDMIERLRSDPGRHPDFRIVGQQLLKYESCQDDIGCYQYIWKEYVPNSHRSALIGQVHTDMSHLGWSKCAKYIRRKFFWPRLLQDVEEQIKQCDVCRAAKSPARITRVPMGSSRCADVPFQMIAIDHWGPVTRSNRGNTYLLVVIDIFSKYVLLHPGRDTKARGVVKFLEDNVFHPFGTPQVLISDNFRALIGRDMIGLLNKYGVEHWTIAYYHSQGNPAERYIRTVSTAIRCYVLENGGDQKRWDENLSVIQTALNNSVNETTKKTPFFLNHGRERIFSGKEYQHLEGPGTRGTLTDSQLKERFDVIRAEVLQNMRRAHQRSRVQYDQRAKPLTFAEDERVWRRFRPLSSSVNEFSAKLAPKYVACYIRKRLGRDTYDVQDESWGPILKYHANDLYKDH